MILSWIVKHRYFLVYFALLIYYSVLYGFGYHQNDVERLKQGVGMVASVIMCKLEIMSMDNAPK